MFGSKNISASMNLALFLLSAAGFWVPNECKSGIKYYLYRIYTMVSFIFLLGIYLLVQLIAFGVFWGDIQTITAIAFVFFTNMAQAIKLFNIIIRQVEIENIIEVTQENIYQQNKSEEMNEVVKRCNKETLLHQRIYFILTTVTIGGWATSAENRNLPLVGWYPFDTTKSPAYELCYTHQVVAILITAYMNISKDTLIVSLMAQAKCQLAMLKISFQNLTTEFDRVETSEREYLKVIPMTALEEEQTMFKLRRLISKHQKSLYLIEEIERCFCYPTLVQFFVSLVIICFTAFQMASMVAHLHEVNLVRVISMGTYLVNMMYQVFIYCYHGTQLHDESLEVLTAVYKCSWYRCSRKIKVTILFIMRRCLKPAILTAGKFSNLSIHTFTAIIKASYSLFTLLQQMNEDK